MYSSEARYGATQFEAPDRLEHQKCAIDGCSTIVIPDDVKEPGGNVRGVGFCCATHYLALEVERETA